MRTRIASVASALLLFATALAPSTTHAAFTSMNIPQRTFQSGTTVLSRAIGTPITRVSADIDASHWTNPATTVEIQVAFSFDSGTTWMTMMDNNYPSPPPWPDDNGTTSMMHLQQSFPSSTPTDYRVSVIVSGPAVTLGPTVLTSQ